MKRYSAHCGQHARPEKGLTLFELIIAATILSILTSMALPLVRITTKRQQERDVQRAVIDQERKDNSIQNYVKDSTLPDVDVEIKNVILDDLRQSPYSARIEFEKVYTNPADHSERKRERWTASVAYVFRENVKNNELAVNPLGLTIVRFRAD
jgi:prepilin-type N-terminal cleavage/methylation domain-containing protein